MNKKTNSDFFSAAELEQLLHLIPSNYKNPNDTFFENSNKVLLSEYKKLGVIVNTKDDGKNKREADESNGNKNIRCFSMATGATIEYFDRAAFEAHRNRINKFRCTYCFRSLPTAFLLQLHVTEQHDPQFAAQVAKNDVPMYACLLEWCEERCKTLELRRIHCIVEHNFPENYTFGQYNVTEPITWVTEEKPKENDGAAVAATMETDAVAVASVTEPITLSVSTGAIRKVKNAAAEVPIESDEVAAATMKLVRDAVEKQKKAQLEIVEAAAVAGVTVPVPFTLSNGTGAFKKVIKAKPKKDDDPSARVTGAVNARPVFHFGQQKNDTTTATMETQAATNVRSPLNGNRFSFNIHSNRMFNSSIRTPSPLTMQALKDALDKLGS